MRTRLLLAAGCLLLGAATAAAQTAPVLFEGARLIPGDGRPAREDTAMLVARGAIVRIAARGEIPLPAGAARIDLTGKTVMPPLIGTHVHPGFQRGLSYGAANYTRETILDDLRRALRFGVSTVLSQGIDRGDVAFQIRDEQRGGARLGARLMLAGRGIGAPNAGPGLAAFAGIAYEIRTAEDARASVRELASRRVDIVKIWVDDRGGRAPKLAPALYRAVIDEAHRFGLRVTAHVFYHDDAEDLVAAGVDAFSHMVRDREMSDALVAAIVKQGIYVNANMANPRRATYDSLPPFLRDGDPMLSLLRATTPGDVIERMRASFTGRDPDAVATARERYDILRRSLAKLAAAGARVVIGADTGLEDHLFGYAEQLELEALVEAGMTPAAAIVAATSRGAAFLHLEDAGVLADGRRADFLVLN
ncbi:MAG: amidohydrolase family protein, partial [Acidobacteriota bacterium]